MLHRFVFQKKARLQFQNICDYIDGEFGVRIADEAFADMRMHPDKIQDILMGKR